MATDIVISTHNRLDYLLQTLSGIRQRTSSDYRLHIIDDGSNLPTKAYLGNEMDLGRVSAVLLRREAMGIPANITAVLGLTQSNPVVFTDDDVLCPLVLPDWLSRGLSAMVEHSNLGLLGLNAPSCNMDDRRKKQYVDGDITRCSLLGGQFLFIKRKVLRDCPPEASQGRSPVKNLCRWVAKQTYGIGYLTDTYCWHFGTVSARTKADVSHLCTEPINMHTLEPIPELRG